MHRILSWWSALAIPIAFAMTIPTLGAMYMLAIDAWDSRKYVDIGDVRLDAITRKFCERMQMRMREEGI